MNTKNKARFVHAILLTGCVAMCGCIDDDFDVTDVDALMGIGNGEITLPHNNSTTEILLEDLLELNESDFITTLDNGDYVLQQECDDVNPTIINIAGVTVSEHSSKGYNVDITIPNEVLNITSTQTIDPITESQPIRTFDYTGTHSDDIVEIESAEVSSSVKLSIHFSSALSSYVASFDAMQVSLPDYLILDNVKASSDFIFDLEKGVLEFDNVPTSSSLEITADLVGLRNFEDKITDEDEYLVVVDGDIMMRGNVHVTATFSQVMPSTADANDCYIHSDLDIDDIYLTNVTGRFDPNIELYDLGEIAINSVPDFLTEEGVVIDLYNPEMIIEITNEIDVPGIMDGVITSKDESGNTLASVNVNDIEINANGITKILICRLQPDDATEYDQVKVVPELSTLVETIPDSISFTVSTTADSTNTGTVELDHDYTLVPTYSFDAPLAFGEDARIIYTDVTDGWNEDLEDLDLSLGSEIKMTGSVVNNVPAFLQIDAVAIDAKGNELGDDLFSIEVTGYAEACREGESDVESPLVILITQKQEGAFNKLDGLKYTVTAYATHNGESVTGITLNKETQTIIIKDINVVLSGMIIADFN